MVPQLQYQQTVVPQLSNRISLVPRTASRGFLLMWSGLTENVWDPPVSDEKLKLCAEEEIKRAALACINCAE